MLNDKDKERFEYMVNESVDDMMHAQSDEQEPPSARYVAMDDAMTQAYEFVKNPKHYQWFDIEVIDAIEKQLTHEQFKGFLMGTSMRYRFRCGSKPGEPLERDINKAKQYEEYWYEYVKRNTPQ